MFKIKIVHKGLILVAVPLIFGTIFISFLLYGLAQTDRLVQRELMLKDAMSSYIMATYCTIETGKCARVYKMTHDPFYKKHCFSYRDEAKAATAHLRKLLRALKLPALPESDDGMMYAPREETNSVFLQKLRRMSDQQTRAAVQAMGALQLALLIGMIASALISIALAVVFCINITNRLLIILSKTVSLSKGTPPGEPLQGHDEIAELDQFLYKSATEIRELERFKKEMIGIVSHELKSPLSSVAGFLSSLSTGVFGELNAKAKDKVERTANSATRLMGLVKELLYLDRLELEIRPEEIAVDKLITTSVDTVKELSQRHGVEIAIKSDGGSVYADHDRLVQVIVNLLSNAMKFSPVQGSVTLETKLTDGSFKCQVSDQGRGIPEQFRKQIFEPFKQVDSRDATTKKGTGLGLTISRSIVEQHGGTIGVESEEGKGSTFWFTIPASGLASDAAKPPSAQSAARSAARSQAQVASQSPMLDQPGLHKPSPRKFSVLAQGMVIIAVPLIFQLAFVSLIGGMLQQVREHTKLEEKSKQILDSVSGIVDIFLGADQAVIFYGMTNEPIFKKAWEDKRNAAMVLIDKAANLSAGDPDRTKDIQAAKDVLVKFAATLAREAKKSQENPKIQKLLSLGGVEQVFGILRNSSGERSESWAKSESMDARTESMGAKSQMMAGFGDMMTEFATKSGMSTIEIMTEFRSIFNHTVKLAKPGILIQSTLDRVMERENTEGKKLAVERKKMIKTLQLTLSAGILLNIALSIFLALTLLRSLTNRLQHVMKNTALMVKREPLDPPKSGADEIAYLDRTLYETAEKLNELETFKRELISVVSHELRTPLLSISSALELFSMGVLGDLSEKAQNRLKFAQDEASRLIRLINDLLDIEKMEAGKFVLDKSEFRVDELINAAIASVAQLAEPKQIKLESSAVDTAIFADRDRLCQVLINLLSNAIKFSPDSGIITVTAEPIDASLEFRVTDQGRGIPEELQEKIFDRFVQVEKTDQTLRGGSGLGLAISRAIVEEHGGSIGVDSQAGKGSTFWFRLPMAAYGSVNRP